MSWWGVTLIAIAAAGFGFWSGRQFGWRLEAGSVAGARWLIRSVLRKVDKLEALNAAAQLADQARTDQLSGASFPLVFTSPCFNSAHRILGEIRRLLEAYLEGRIVLTDGEAYGIASPFRVGPRKEDLAERRARALDEARWGGP